MQVRIVRRVTATPPVGPAGCGFEEIIVQQNNFARHVVYVRGARADLVRSMRKSFIHGLFQCEMTENARG
jgi:hypothetical protein